VRSTLSSFQFLRSQIRTTLIKAKEGERTDSGKVSDYREAAQLAESFFCTPAWEAKHKDGVINQVVVFASDAKDMVERPTVEPTYSTLVGQKKLYSYLPIRPGVMASRCGSHWCDACMRVRGPGVGMTAGLVVDGVAGKCTGPEKRWTEHHVERVDAAGVANERKRAQALGHKLARKLKVGDWVAVQARERWSTKEVVHYRAGALAHAPSCRLPLHH
jgi:hypothetical protein